MRFDEVANKWWPESMERKNSKRINRAFIKKVIRFGIRTILHPAQLLRNIYWKFNIHTQGNVHISSHCAIDLRQGALIDASNGTLNFGNKRNLKSKMETRLLVEENAKFVINGTRNILYNSDIQIFKGATLTMGKGACNSGLQIVCADKITIGDNTFIGRDVWIRDNNGGHHIIQTGYTDKAPVRIGNYVWIGSNVQIMKGVTIGDGAVIAGNSVVTTNIPARTMASGNPAKVVAEDITWVH